LLEKPSVSPGHLPWYRLPHERLIPSLHQLTGVILAAVEQTRLTFDAAFRAWQNNGQRRRYLLDRRTLRQVETHLAQIPPGDVSEAKARFLQRSQQHRNRMFLAEVMLGVLVVGMIAAGLWFDTQRRHTNDLSAWALPPDLYTYQRQLKTLEMAAPVRHLRWLHAKLTTLEIYGSALQDLTTLSPALSLTTLTLSGTGLTSLAGLEKLPQLTTLNLSYTGQLRQLGIFNLGSTSITSIKMLSNSQNLKILVLPKEIPSLDGLPASVNHLALQ
jgi:hypothetical protein